MSAAEELSFLLGVLCDLNENYPSHNKTVLEDLINVVKYRIELEHKRIKTT